MKFKIVRDKDTSRVDFEVYDEDFETRQWYHTNKDGEGLWKGEDYMKQIVGTCDFRLHQKTYSGIYKAIKKWFEW